MSNILKLLIETEKKYLENLELIDSKISPQWMKQFESVAPDFTELLKCIQDIISVNKPFYERLTQIDDLHINFDNLVLNLTNDIQPAYKLYTEHLINNLNKRQDVLCTPSIQQFLLENKDVTLENLFHAPLYQLSFYKSLFNRTDITVSQDTLLKVNQILDTLMTNSMPPIDLDHFFSQLDCSKVVDILDENYIPNYTLPSVSKVLLFNSFVCTDISKYVQLVLTTDSLIFCSQDANESDYLLYTPVEINDISIRTIHSDRELIGEYNIQLWIQKQKLLVLKSKSKAERNLWLGLDENSSSKDHSWIPLLDIVHKYDTSHRSTAKFKASAPKPIRTTDFFTVFTESSDTISPLVSSDEEEDSVSVDKPLPQITLPQEPVTSQSLPVHNQSLENPLITPEAPTVSSLSSAQLSKESPKKPSFMRSVMSAVSLKPNKKSSVDSLSNAFSATVIEPPQHHLTIPSQNSLANNRSTPSFTSMATSSQSSLNMTPPLSRSSSPGSVTPAQFSRHPSSSSSEDLGTPPESPEMMNYRNTIKQILYSNEECQVFHWKDESWYAVEDECVLEVRQTVSNQCCVAVHLKKTGQFYLNAWILPDTVARRTNETDINLTISNAETYLFHCPSQSEADALADVLLQMHPSVPATDTTPFQLAMQCKCKLYVQNASSKWTSFGSVAMKISQQSTLKKMHIAIETHKGGKQLVSATVQSNNVERLSTRRISFMMVDEIEKNSVVYMIQVREETTADKILEYIKVKNAENGW